MSAATAVSEATWSDQVLNSDKPVLVDFWAEWCPPCKIIAPVLDEIAIELGEKAKIVKVNVDENPNVARQFNVLGIPTLLLFKDGQAVDSISGAQPKSVITKMINKAL
jgi:thioredoxin 1